jgi:hypothetical protein
LRHSSPRPAVPWPRSIRESNHAATDATASVEITFWTYYEPVTAVLSPVAYAHALEHLHAGMRTIDAPTPQFTDRVAEVSMAELLPR